MHHAKTQHRTGRIAQLLPMTKNSGQSRAGPIHFAQQLLNFNGAAQPWIFL
jgi:hypothetical protein